MYVSAAGAVDADTNNLNRKVIKEANGVTIYNGGFGSGMARSVSNPELLYFLTDRGPNFNGPESGQKVFPDLFFSPSVAVYKFDGTSLEFQREFKLKDKDGYELLGLPNPEGLGGLEKHHYFYLVKL